MTMPKDTVKAAEAKEKIRQSRLGKHHSEETKRKMSESRKGEKNPFFGKTLSEEAKEKIRDAKTGKSQSQETCERRRKAMLKFYAEHPEEILKKSQSAIGDKNPNYGKPMSDEQKKKLSLAKTGDRHFNFGKHLSPETREKIRVANSGENCYHYGESPSEETRLKMSLSQRGEKCYNWKGGITELNHAIRTCLKNRNWIQSVFKRDNFTCKKCGATKVYLHAHHIKLFSEIIKEHNITTIEEAEACDELWDINNGISLCEECHAGEHKANGVNECQYEAMDPIRSEQETTASG